MATSSVCQSQYDAIVTIKSTNDKLESNYDTRYNDYIKNYEDWQKKHNQWQLDFDTFSNLVSEKSSWIELNGSAFNCASLKEDSILCCSSHNLKRKKCTLQNKGGTVKCSNKGACAWPLASTSCCSGKCRDLDANYCKNATITDGSLPISESQWVLDGKRYPEPVEPIKPDPVIYQPYPNVVCQDCSSHIETLESEDVTMDQIFQTSKCISDLSFTETQTQTQTESQTETETESESSNSLLANFSSQSNSESNSQSNSESLFDFSELFNSLLLIFIGLIVMIFIIWILSLVFSSTNSNRNIRTNYNSN